MAFEHADSQPYEFIRFGVAKYFPSTVGIVVGMVIMIDVVLCAT